MGTVTTTGAGIGTASTTSTRTGPFSSSNNNLVNTSYETITNYYPLYRFIDRGMRWIMTFLDTSWKLVYASIVRDTLLVYFFLYICLPKEVIPRSDVFICVVVFIFSLFSGFLSVLCYEYAAQLFPSQKAHQAYAGNLMNMTFQLSAFTAVLLGLFVIFKAPSTFST